MQIKKTLVGLLVCTLLMGCVTSCNNDNKPDETETTETKSGYDFQLDGYEGYQEDLKETLKISEDALGIALSEHLFLSTDFVFEISHNQSVELSDNGTGEYIHKNTYIYTGKLNKTQPDRTIESDQANFTMSISFEGNNTFPSNITTDIVAYNKADHSNMTQWAYQIIGEIIPVTMASKIQNAPNGVLTENIYSEDAFTSSVFKEIKVGESDTNITTISIMCKSTNKNNFTADVNEFILSGGPTLGLYKFTLFDPGSTLSNMENRTGGMYSKGTLAKLQMLSTSTIQEATGKRESTYSVFNITNNKYCEPFDITFITDTKHEDAFKRKEYVYVSFKTLAESTLDLAQVSVKSLMDAIFYVDINLEEVLGKSEFSLEVTDETGYGFPILMSVSIEKTDLGYVADVVCESINK